MGLALDEPENNEKASPVNGLDVLISDEVKAFAEGSLVDYVRTPYGEGFDIETGFGSC